MADHLTHDGRRYAVLAAAPPDTSTAGAHCRSCGATVIYDGSAERYETAAAHPHRMALLVADEGPATPPEVLVSPDQPAVSTDEATP